MANAILAKPLFLMRMTKLCTSLCIFVSLSVYCRKSTTKQRPRSYRVMLHNDDFNRREYVVKVLLKVLDNFTMEDAINCMQVGKQTFLPCHDCSL